MVKIACIAQLVNVIAPIMTEKGGRAWRQTIFHPLHLASRYGRGRALNLNVEVPAYDSTLGDGIPYLDIAAVEGTDGTVALFAVSRHQTEAMTVEVALHGFDAKRVLDHQEIRNDSLRAVNTADRPEAVAPRKGTGAAIEGGVLKLTLAPLSYAMIRVGA